MKQLLCEICGDSNLLKHEDVFICQNCGAQYSIENVKKMLCNDTDTPSGADINKKIENYMTLAHSARNSGNNAEAEEYCNKVLEISSTHSEAWFLKGVAAGWQSSEANLRVDEFLSCVANALKNAPTLKDLNKLYKQAKIELYELILAINQLKINNIVSYPPNYETYGQFRSLLMLWSVMHLPQHYDEAYSYITANIPESEVDNAEQLDDFDVYGNAIENCDKMLIQSGIDLWNSALDEFQSSGSPSKYSVEKMMNNGGTAIKMLEEIIPDIPESITGMSNEQKQLILKSCKNLITMKTVWMDLKSCDVDYIIHTTAHTKVEDKRVITAQIRQLHNIISICDPSYEIPDVPEPTEPSTGGCYVATCVYGSYDCPEVWTLRRYRDYTLDTTWYGRAFIKVYYAISPTIVEWFGETAWFKKLWKGKLDKMVAELQKQGYESTKYNDKY